MTPMPIKISLRADVKSIAKKLDSLGQKQVPFATAQALTALAKRVQEGEKENILKVFPTATPFTVKSVGMKPARKNDPTAVVFVKDIAAQYLRPFEDGGRHFLGDKRGLLKPVDQPVNRYGNLPRNTLKRLKGRKDVFVGVVKTKNGQEINGVWQRPVKARGVKPAGELKLLIRFTDPEPVRQHLGYHERAQTIVRRWFKKDFGAALGKAMATAK